MLGGYRRWNSCKTSWKRSHFIHPPHLYVSILHVPAMECYSPYAAWQPDVRPSLPLQQCPWLHLTYEPNYHQNHRTLQTPHSEFTVCSPTSPVSFICMSLLHAKPTSFVCHRKSASGSLGGTVDVRTLGLIASGHADGYLSSSCWY